MPDDEMTRRLKEQRIREIHQQGSQTPTPARVDPKAELKRARLLARELLAILKTRNNIEDWELVLAGMAGKRSQAAGHPIAWGTERSYRDGSMEPYVTIYLLENGNLVYYGSEIKIDSRLLIDRLQKA